MRLQRELHSPKIKCIEVLGDTEERELESAVDSVVSASEPSLTYRSIVLHDSLTPPFLPLADTDSTIPNKPKSTNTTPIKMVDPSTLNNSVN
jgi:hypothetical protein